MMSQELLKQRQIAKEYDDLDTMYAYVSFRTQSIREEFEDKIKLVNRC